MILTENVLDGSVTEFLTSLERKTLFVRARSVLIDRKTIIQVVEQPVLIKQPIKIINTPAIENVNKLHIVHKEPIYFKKVEHVVEHDLLSKNDIFKND